MNMFVRGFILGAAGVFALAAPASAVLFVGSTVSGESGNTLAASADFSLSGTTLTVVLTNTTTDITEVNSDLLSGVMWDVGGSSSIVSADSVDLTAGSSITFDGLVDGSPVDLTSGAFDGDVSGEFGYVDDIQSSNPGALGGADFGVAANGFGPFGSATLISSNNLDDPEAPNGPNFGIQGAGAVATPANWDGLPLITNTNAGQGGSVTIELTVADGFDLMDIDNVWFQYGTSLDQPGFGGECGDGCEPPIPEPATISLLGLGLAGMALSRARRKLL